MAPLGDEPRSGNGSMWRSHPIAYFITFRTYGSWLPGDERGWVRHGETAYGTPFLPPDATLEATAAATMKQPAVRLDADQRARAVIAVRDACDYRSWQLHAINVRTNHVHCVVAAECPPEEAMNILKQRITRSLREAGLASRHGKLWSYHGSTIYLWTERQLAEACNYVSEYQGPG